MEIIATKVVYKAFGGESDFENSIGKYIHKWTLKATVKAYS